MGSFTTTGKIYKPASSETNWGSLVNSNLDRMSEMCANVKAYGAIGDGVTDDTSAIQTAINDVSAAHGGIVYFPVGKYNIVGSGGVGLSMPSGDYPVTLIGCYGRSHNESVSSPYGSSLTTSTSGLVLFDLTSLAGPAQRFWGPKVFGMNFVHTIGGSGAILVRIGSCDNYEFSYCGFRGASHTDTNTIGISLTATIDNSYAGIGPSNSFYDCFSALKVGTNSGSGSIRFFNNNVFGYASNHILLDLADGPGLVQGNKFECNDASNSIAIKLTGSTGSTRIIGNSFEGCPTGVDNESTALTNKSVFIDGNHFTGTNNTEEAIKIGSSSVVNTVFGTNWYVNVAKGKWPPNCPTNYFPTTAVLDNFTGTNGTQPPSANWTGPAIGASNNLAIQSNQATSNANAFGADTWNPASTQVQFSDSEVYVTVPTLPTAGDAVYLYWRMSGTTGWNALTGYKLFVVPSTGSWTLRRKSISGETTLGNTTQAFSTGDSLGVLHYGGIIAIFYQPSGGTWSPIFYTYEGGLASTSGYIALACDDNVVRMDAFGGGMPTRAFL